MRIAEAIALFLIVGGQVGPLSAASALRTVGELNQALRDPAGRGQPFDLEGEVKYVIRSDSGWMIHLYDGDDISLYELTPKERPQMDYGDTVHVRGRVTDFNGTLLAEYDSVNVIARMPGNRTRDIGIGEIYASETLKLQVRLQGTVRECFRDESDPNWIYAVLADNGTFAYAIIYSAPRLTFDPDGLIGRRISIFGLCDDAHRGLRQHTSRTLFVPDTGNIRILDPPNADPFDAPDLAQLVLTPPPLLMSLGRHRVSGTVVAVWNGRNALLRTAGGLLVTLTFGRQTLPACGQRIDAVGLPGTNLYHLNLSHAAWKSTGQPQERPENPTPVDAGTLLTDSHGHTKISISTHGQAIRLKGTIRHLPSDKQSEWCFFIESDGQLIPIDVTASPDVLKILAVGCTVAVDGVCIIECDAWTPNDISPQASGIRLAIRSSGDVTVLDTPSWWTPGRIWSAIGILLSALLGIIAWNVALRRLVLRRGRELAREQISRAEAELKIQERTRLAVELHDTLSQNLMGVSMRLDAVKRAAAIDVRELPGRIDVTARALNSCRDELRNCLWDLRNAALEAPDMSEAIRQTLAPHLDEPLAVTIRFNVPRTRLTDHTAHAILQIVRELTLNAVRHGHASHIRIAGSIEDDTLRLSVRDDGCGFDCDRVPGIKEGHFGLQGIRERIDLLDGTMEIESATGRGTKVTISLRAPHAHAEKEQST